MSLAPKTSRIALAVLLSLTLVFAGCFASKFTLIALDKAKVDKAYVGDWDLVNPKGEHADLVIRNIDDKTYYVEVKGKTETKPSRYVGFTVPVGNATFAHVRPLQDDGSVPDGWILMRVQIADGWITLRQLSEDFFKDKPVGSAEQLRAVIEKNVETEAMYARDEVLTGKKIAQ